MDFLHHQGPMLLLFPLEYTSKLVYHEVHYQNFYEFPIKSLNYLVIICFDL